MKDTEWGWVSKQLAGAKIPVEINEAVVYCLKTLREQDIDDAAEIQAISLLLNLLKGHSIAVDEPEERWGHVIPGDYRIGDTVRVRLNAFDGEKGMIHNGKRGRITAARNGLVRVLLNDSPSSDIQTYYSPEHLERLR